LRKLKLISHPLVS